MFTLDDVNDTPLKRFASEQGIPINATTTKPQLIQLIRERFSPDGALLLIPVGLLSAGGGAGERWMTFSAITTGVSALASIAVVVLTFFIARANIDSAKANADAAESSRGLFQTELVKLREVSEKDAASKAEEKKTSWQYVIVYKIIADGMKGEWNGLTLDEIRRRYATEVAAVKDIDVGRPDLQEMAIRKVVLGLIESQLVYNTIDDRYVIQGSVVNSKDEIRRTTSNNQVSYAIFGILSNNADAGKHTVSELGQKVMSTVKATSPEEYNFIIAQFVAQKLLIIGEDGKVWSASNPPAAGKK